ncbi:MAG: copper chaperone PCu(A)C [Burkholderiaceae bacterium]|jgi:copper(I)-binding protein|nr:copper chaperone PCu(A)C [Burkholderiaceae bacterium]MBP7659380.1 copper chaperone PCu(A)C [Burkholderiaceae bacterium]
MKRLMLTALATLLTTSPVLAQVTVADPWVRGTVAQQRATGAFMKLTAPAGARLVEARSPMAGVVEIHEMTMDNNVMRMRQVPMLELPAGKAVELKPGGYHVMLMDLKQPMKTGESVPITLVFEDKDKKRLTVDIQAPVRALNAPAGKMEHKH